MPTSKVTRVRSDGFSKISATERPSSGVPRRPAFQRCLRSAASRNRSEQVLAVEVAGREDVLHDAGSRLSASATMPIARSTVGRARR